LGSSLPPTELASAGFRRFRGNEMPIFHCTGGKKRWRKSGVFFSEKLQLDAVQGGPACPVSSNRRQRRTREGRGPARPVPRGTRASGHAPSGQRMSQCRSTAVARRVMFGRTRSSLDSDRTPGAAHPVKQCNASGRRNRSLDPYWTLTGRQV
jgi:hypothetical protein